MDKHWERNPTSADGNLSGACRLLSWSAIDGIGYGWIVLLLLMLGTAWPEEEAPQPKGEVLTIRGKIIAIHEDIQTAVLNVGEADGVSEGMLFRAHRDEQFVAHLRVRNVFPDMAVAAIERKSGPVKSGDLVTTRFLEADTAASSPEPNHTEGPKSEPVSLPKLRGQILAIDSRVDLVVFNLGKKHGVQPGQQFTVSRGNDWVATLVAHEIKEKMTVAAIHMQRVTVQVGDSVVPRARENSKPDTR